MLDIPAQLADLVVGYPQYTERIAKAIDAYKALPESVTNPICALLNIEINVRNRKSVLPSNAKRDMLQQPITNEIMALLLLKYNPSSVDEYDAGLQSDQKPIEPSDDN